MAAETTVKIVIQSDVRLVDVVHTAAERIAELAGFEEEDTLSIALAVREAVINAVKHGNGSRREVPVDVVLAANESGFRAEVFDRGKGFDPAATPDPTVGDNRLRTSGRGLLLIRAFVDDVRFRFVDGQGMEVVLTKNRRAESAAGEGRP